MDSRDFSSYKQYFVTRKNENLTNYARNKLKRHYSERENDGIEVDANRDIENVESDCPDDIGSPGREPTPAEIRNREEMESDNDTISSIDDSEAVADEIDNDISNDILFPNFQEVTNSIQDNVQSEYISIGELQNDQANNSFSDDIQNTFTSDYNLPYEVFEDEFDNLRNSKKPETLEDLMNSEEYTKKISTEVIVTPLEVLYMLLKFSVVHKLPLTTLSNLVTLVNSIFATPIMPGSRYMLNKFFNETKNTQFHITCAKCGRYISNLTEIVGDFTCRHCRTKGSLKDPTMNNCVAIIDPSITIKNLLEAHENYYTNVLNEERPPNVIRDIYDGKLYKQFRESLPPGEKLNYVSVTINTDGAEPFKKSPRSLWPLFVMINEIPPQDRFDNIIPCALWFNRNKPRMSIFLQLFVNLISSINEEGIKCIIKSEKRSIKIFPLVSCVDTVARNPMQGLMAFNAKFGCSWCKHPTEYYVNATKYPLTSKKIPFRTKEETVKVMRTLPKKVTKKIARKNKGVRSMSPLINLPYFDIILSFVPDYMHFSLLGVVKQITGYEIPNNSSIQDYHGVMNKIKLPNQVSRFTRPIEDCKYWKAREWENWVLYVSMFLFTSKNKDEKFIKYWSMLVESMHILLQNNISNTNLNNANKMLIEFVIQTEERYGKRAMTYNVHQLLHVTESVLNWGPLWAHSAFCFEAGNRKLLQSIHCANGVIQQIVRYSNISNSVSTLEHKLFAGATEVAKSFYDNTFGKRVKKFIKINNRTYFGKGELLDEETRNILQFSAESYFYDRMVKDGCLYLSDNVVNRRSDNSIAFFNDSSVDTYIKINRFAVDHERKQEKVIFQYLIPSLTKVTENCAAIQQIIGSSVTKNVMETKFIQSVCVNMRVNENHLVCKVPNLFYY